MGLFLGIGIGKGLRPHGVLPACHSGARGHTSRRQGIWCRVGSGAFAVFSLNRSTVLGSAVGISAPAPAKVQSYGNNAISGVEAGTVLTPLSLR